MKLCFAALILGVQGSVWNGILDSAKDVVSSIVSSVEARTQAIVNDVVKEKLVEYADKAKEHTSGTFLSSVVAGVADKGVTLTEKQIAAVMCANTQCHYPSCEACMTDITECCGWYESKCCSVGNESCHEGHSSLKTCTSNAENLADRSPSQFLSTSILALPLLHFLF
eukprot:Protomagalhaensia_wolfi_Nauph_80__6031@NODE_831_length_1966_cov_5835_702128_g508_i1_p1_GENE_NODE_831_length_1966_cov_5835_702128_g508_i1NODE_831_length_1966_cov_5835_702128_g508_i1_p1_ORF_typecomplete_len168_score34_14Perilipin/PF03036_16/0_39_NODE_831_length_1966_cov_5835_702128_g508_i136539